MKIAIALLLILVGWWLVCKTDVRYPTRYQDWEGTVGAILFLVGTVILVVALYLRLTN